MHLGSRNGLATRKKGGADGPFRSGGSPSAHAQRVVLRFINRLTDQARHFRVPFAAMLAVLRGGLASLILVLNTLIGVTCMMPFALLKLLLPFDAMRHLTDRALNAIATGWIGVNNAWIDVVSRTRWDVQGLEGLEPGGWYLVSSNHQSWVDILVLQKVFNRRIPLLKFFLKRELIWVPVIGLAWWALDFPFMRRRGGLAGAEDLERARQACRKFSVVPTSVINFLEGTRYTRAKHDAQGSPYRHLLKPKVGGIATALTTLGSQFHRLLDVTIVYPDGAPEFWTCCRAGCGGWSCASSSVRSRRSCLPATTPAIRPSARACRTGSTRCGYRRTR